MSWVKAGLKRQNCLSPRLITRKPGGGSARCTEPRPGHNMMKYQAHIAVAEENKGVLKSIPGRPLSPLANG